MEKIFMVLYNVSSVHKVIDFVKTIYAFNTMVPVIVKPLGAAAQIGVPEANKFAYKLNKPLIILPELEDIINVLNVSKNYMVSGRGTKKSLEEFIRMVCSDSVAITINGGDTDFTNQELEYGTPINIVDIPLSISSTAIAGIIAYEIAKFFKICFEKK